MQPRTPASPDPGAPPRPRRSPPGRLAIALAYLLFLILVVEAGSFAALSLRSGGLASGARLREAMALAAEEPEQASPLAELGLGRSIHPYLGFMPRSWSQDTDLVVRMNMPGFYEPSSPIFDTSEDALIIGVSGGSVAGNFTRSGGAQTLVEGLQALPRFAGKRIRFALFAGGGWKQPQQLMALNYLFALGGHLDLMIELDGFNEVALHERENQQQGIAPIYPRAWFFMTQRHELAGGMQRLESLRRARMQAARAAVDSPLSRSWTYRLIWTQRDRRLARAIRKVQDELREFQPETDPSQPRDLILSGPLTRAATPDARLDELADIWANCSIQMQRLCHANGVEYFHFLQPNQYVPGTKTLSAEERETAYDPDPELYVRPVEQGYLRLFALADELRAQGVRLGDLTRVFEDVAETIYVDACCHVNELGNRLMAEAMLRFIETELH